MFRNIKTMAELNVRSRSRDALRFSGWIQHLGSSKSHLLLKAFIVISLAVSSAISGAQSVDVRKLTDVELYQRCYVRFVKCRISSVLCHVIS